MKSPVPLNIKSELDGLIGEFFQAVSFLERAKPSYGRLYQLFIQNGLLIKNSQDRPEISNISQFIESREKLISSGELTSFNEIELAEITEIFSNVAHRFSTYEKSGTLNRAPFTTRGIISTQFIMTPDGWKVSSMAWDDERPGIVIPDRYKPKESTN